MHQPALTPCPNCHMDRGEHFADCSRNPIRPDRALWQVEEADQEAAERARVAEWVAEHPDPVTAALARAVAAEVEVVRLRELLVEGDEDEDEGYSVRCGRAVCDDANPHRSGCRCYKDAEHDGMHGCEHADWPVHGLDHIARAKRVVTAVMGSHQFWQIEHESFPERIVDALHRADALTSPARDAKVAARALRDASDDFYVASSGTSHRAHRWLHDRADRIEREGGAS